MSIQRATLLPGHIPLGVGVNGARRGFAQTFGGSRLPVVFKAVPESELAAELFCAVLGRNLDLPVPEPLLIRDPSNGRLVFGGVDAKFPNLLQTFRLSLDPPAYELRPVAERLQQWPRIAEVVWFDEWIQNTDRNLQNVLWDGGEEFIFIDHGRSLGLAGNTTGLNKLVKILLIPIETDHAAIQKLKARVLNAAIDFGMEHAESSASDLCQLKHGNFKARSDEFIKLLTIRLPRLAGLVARHFPSPQMTLEYEST